MNKTKVICDTNVWYGIAKHGLISELDQFDLYSTNLTLYEIISSQNIEEKGFQLVRDSVVAMTKHSKEILSQNIAQQIIIRQMPSYVDEIAYQQRDNIFRIIKEFVHAKNISGISYDFKEMIEKRNDNMSYTSNNLKEKINLLKASKDMTSEDFSTNILRELSSEYLLIHRPDINEQITDFSSFNLFISCFSEFVNSFFVASKKKVDKNDIIDFLNLLYCTDDYKYLTLEGTRKIRIGRILESKDEYILPNRNTIRNKLNLPTPNIT